MKVIWLMAASLLAGCGTTHAQNRGIWICPPSCECIGDDTDRNAQVEARCPTDAKDVIPKLALGPPFDVPPKEWDGPDTSYRDAQSAWDCGYSEGRDSKACAQIPVHHVGCAN